MQKLGVPRLRTANTGSLWRGRRWGSLQAGPFCTRPQPDDGYEKKSII